MPTLNAWETMGVAPGTILGGALAYDGKDFIYALRGNTTTDFYRYSISGNSWSTMTSITAALRFGGMAYTGGNFIYATNGNDTTTFYRYDIAADSWSTMTPITAAGHPLLVYTGGNFIYALRDYTGVVGTTDFYRYSISGNSWSTMTSITAATIAGVLVYTGGDFIYALRGNNTTDFYRYYEDDSTNYLKEYDLTAILSISKIYSFSWIDRHITLTGKLSSKANMEYLETKTRKLRGGAVTILVPGGEEEYQDLTTDNANIFWLKFSTTDHLKSNLRNGYYLISSCEFEPIRGTIDQFQFTLTGFWITSILGIIGSDV